MNTMRTVETTHEDLEYDENRNRRLQLIEFKPCYKSIYPLNQIDGS